LHNLAWGSAIAADVYDWAKQQSLLGGEYNSQTGRWGWSSDSGYDLEQREVAAYIKKETANIKIRIVPYNDSSSGAGSGSGATGWYDTQVSTDNGLTWVSSNTPFRIDIEAYTAGTGLQLSGTEFSIDPATVTYTPAGEGTDANLSIGNNEESLPITGNAISSIKNYIDAKAVSASAVTIEESSPADYAKAYTFSQNGTEIGTINIPKDFLVKSGKVIEVVEFNGQYYDKTDTGHTNPLPVNAAGKYLDFVVNTKDSSAGAEEYHMYIAVSDLVDVYTGDDTEYIEVDIDSNVITATLKDAMIADEIGSGTGDDLLTTVDAVREYVQSEISQATPNLTGVEAIEVGPGSGSGIDTTEVSLKLDESSTISGSDQVSGLTQSNAGLKIDDTITWVLQCGDSTFPIE